MNVSGLSSATFEQFRSSRDFEIIKLVCENFTWGLALQGRKRVLDK